MASETVAVGADHGGYSLKVALKELLSAKGYEVIDFGTDSEDSVDYPEFADLVADAVSGGRAQRGLLVCGSGIGMSIAANRHPGIRAALCHDRETARLSRQHNNANVLVLGGRMTDRKTAEECLELFLETDFEGGRHQRRVDKLK